MQTFESFPRVHLAHLPTPLEPMTGLSRELRLDLFIKRDDCSGLATGGNKARKLEYLLADALAHQADTVVTVGAIQSNHARQTAAACARLGLRCELGLTSLEPIPSSGYGCNGNILLDGILGARVHRFPIGSDSGAVLRQLVAQVQAEGRRPYAVPVGGSNALGALGYARAAVEIAEQAASLGLRNPLVILATGSGGTQAGLLIGSAVAKLHFPVLGISVSRQSDQQVKIVGDVARDLARLLGVEPPSSDTIRVYDGYVGRGYGQPTTEMVRAVRLAATADGILLDPVYSGKAMAGLLDLARRGDFADYDAVVFLHTGGAAALFAYVEIFGETPPSPTADFWISSTPIGGVP